MIADADAGRTITLFEDEYRSPVALSDVVETIAVMIDHEYRGILHVGGPRLSRYELGRAILRKHGLAEQAVATSLSDYTGPPRTPDTSFDTALAERVLGRSLRDLAAILEDC
jgi:dTDP-4-dehydrorhamnose reductase